MSRFDEWVRAEGTDPDPRFTLANERTFLSWMTTSLGMLGAGLAVGTIGSHSGFAESVGVLWIVMGAIVALRSMFRWLKLERAMRRGEGLPLSRSIPFVSAAIGLLSLASIAAMFGP